MCSNGSYNGIAMEHNQNYRQNILDSGMSIYDPIQIGDPDLWIPSDSLEAILTDSLAGQSLAGLPLRTRSKVAKQLVCDALGYPRPTSFKKTNPRFPGQNFDTYVQKSNNLQVWNEELEATRRYVLIRLTEEGVISQVKVVNGDCLARLDTTGTLTQKYQARLIPGDSDAELIIDQDTPPLCGLISQHAIDLSEYSPTGMPCANSLLPIQSIFNQIIGMVGTTFEDAGSDQERNRGAALHNIVCQALGYSSYADNGRFPDIRHQLLEVKLQTSPTIDLGLVTPESTDPLDMPVISDVRVRHCDVRYALFYGDIRDGVVTITNVYLTTGESFFSRFPQFGGMVLNRKSQLTLPRSFFD